jgi:hypothetical protein
MVATERCGREGMGKRGGKCWAVRFSVFCHAEAWKKKSTVSECNLILNCMTHLSISHHLLQQKQWIDRRPQVQRWYTNVREHGPLSCTANDLANCMAHSLRCYIHVILNQISRCSKKARVSLIVWPSSLVHFFGYIMTWRLSSMTCSLCHIFSLLFYQSWSVRG